MPDSDPEPTPDQIALLLLAHAKARRLVAGLQRQAIDLERRHAEHPDPTIPPERLAMGRLAFEKALASARRTLEAINGALAAAGVPEPPIDPSFDNPN